jgi:hypothetical protein
MIGKKWKLTNAKQVSQWPAEFHVKLSGIQARGTGRRRIGSQFDQWRHTRIHDRHVYREREMKWNEMRAFPGPFVGGPNGSEGNAPNMKVEVIIITLGRPYGAHSSVGRQDRHRRVW